MALGYVIPLTQIDVSAETQGKANVTIKPKENDSYQISRNNQNIDLSDIHAGDKFDFNYDWSWSVPENQSGNSQYIFNYQLPQNITYDIKSGRMVEQDIDYGTYEVTSDGQVKFTFNNNLASNRGISGVLKVSGQVKSNLPKGSKIEFQGFPGDEKSIEVKASSTNDVSTNLYAENNSDSGNTIVKNSQKVRGESYINRNNREFEPNLEIVTSFTKSLLLSPNGITISEVELNIDGSENKNSTETQLIKDVDYTVDSTNYTIKLKKETTKTLKINYYFDIDTNSLPYKSSTNDFQQTVSVKNNQTTLASSTSPSLRVQYDNFINNSDNGLFGNTYFWRSEYNYNHKKLDPNTPIKISVSNNSSTDADYLKSDSFKIYEVDNTSQQNTNKKALTLGSDYTLSSNADNTETTITLKNGTSAGIYIEYTTVLDTYEVPNPQDTVRMKTLVSSLNQSDDADQTISKSGLNSLFFSLYREDEPIDYNTLIATWHYDINTNRYANQTFNIDNPLPNGITLADDDPNFILKDGSKKQIGKATKNADGTFTVKGKNNAQFTITINEDNTGLKVVGQNISDRYFLCYDTKFDPNIATLDNNMYNFKNNTATATVNDSMKVNSSAKLRIKRDAKDGFMIRRPDINNRQIIWDSVVNPSRQHISDAPITAVISNGRIVKLEVYKANLTSTGEIDESSLKPINTIAPDTANNKKATFIPENDSDDIYLLRLTASLDDMVVNDGQTITNSLFYNKDYTPFLKDSYDLPNRGEFVTKSGEFNSSSKQVDWTLDFNKSQSRMTNAVIVDDPSNNQVVDYNSFDIQQIIFDKNGNPTYSTNYLDKSKYRVEKEKLEDNTSNKFKITFFDSVDKAYRIHYKTSLIFLDDKIINDFKLTYKTSDNTNHTYTPNRPTQVTTPTTQDMEVHGQKRLSINIKLIDKDTRKALKDGKFKIEFIVNNNNSHAFIKSTDADGTLSWHDMIGGNYIIKQITAPDGYEIPTEWQEGKSFKLGDANTSSNNINLEVENFITQQQSSETSESSQSNSGDSDPSIPQDKESSQSSENNHSSQTDSSSTNKESQSSDSDSSLPQDKESAQSSENSQSDSSTTNSTTQSTTTQSSSNKPTSNLPQTGQKHDLTLKYVGIIIVLISGFILYPALKKRR